MDWQWRACESSLTFGRVKENGVLCINGKCIVYSLNVQVDTVALHCDTAAGASDVIVEGSTFILGNGGGGGGWGSVLSGSEDTNGGGVERGKWTGSGGLVKLILTFGRVKENGVLCIKGKCIVYSLDVQVDTVALHCDTAEGTSDVTVEGSTFYLLGVQVIH